MPSAIAYIQWETYTKGADGRGFYAAEPLSFNSRQQRLHMVGDGEKLWLASRCPKDGQYYLVAVLCVNGQRLNDPGAETGKRFGEFGVTADRGRSHELQTRLPADGLLRALQFESGKPIKFGSSLGQSLQTLRFLSREDDRVLEAALARVRADGGVALDVPFGLWTKCDGVFADYFWRNWRVRREPLAFLVYDSPPVLPLGAPVFIHSDRNLRLVASFCGSQFIAGYKPTINAEERILERERIWSAFRAATIDPPAKPDFDKFWDSQHGVRSLFLMDNLTEFPAQVPFKVYGRALEWGYPMGVGYRYLTFSQAVLLLRASELPEAAREPYLMPLLSQATRARREC